jgi:hypothetical protein
LEARRLVESFEWHYTPKHGSWLNMAESEPLSCPINVSIGVSRTGAASSARLPPGSSTATLTMSKLTGRFTAADARIKLKSLYPAL